MQDILTRLERIRRPQLLIRAARLGAAEYQRTRALKRLLGDLAPYGNGAALAELMEIERELNEKRASDDASYSATRHVEVLIAVMGEAQLLRASRMS